MIMHTLIMASAETAVEVDEVSTGAFLVKVGDRRGEFFFDRLSLSFNDRERAEVVASALRAEADQERKDRAAIVGEDDAV